MIVRSLELKVPPPVVGLLIAAAMWWVAGNTPRIATAQELRIASTAVLAAIGVALDLAAGIAFVRARTTIHPLKPQATTRLVRSGVYRLTRNPMYVGLAFLLLAWAAFLSSLFALAGPIAFVLYITRFQIIPEERVLAHKFGAEYAAYRARVRRWL